MYSQGVYLVTASTATFAFRIMFLEMLLVLIVGLLVLELGISFCSNSKMYV